MLVLVRQDGPGSSGFESSAQGPWAVNGSSFDGSNWGNEWGKLEHWQVEQKEAKCPRIENPSAPL